MASIRRRVFSQSRQLQRQTGAAKSRPAPSVSRTLSPAKKAPPPQLDLSSPTKPILSYADQLLRSGPEVLLYRSPGHRSFFITSYVVGGLLLFGAYNWAVLAQPPPGQKKARGAFAWLVLGGSMATTLFMAVAGTALILAPVKMIKSVSCRRAGAGEIMSRPVILSFEMKSSLPFMKTKTFEALPSETFLDRRVSAQDIDFKSIPLSGAQAFTASTQAHATPPQQNIIVRAWGTLLRDTRRMFLRDGIAYVRFAQHGNWKLDLQNAELLDNGRPLERLTTPDRQRGVGLVSFMQRYLTKG